MSTTHTSPPEVALRDKEEAEVRAVLAALPRSPLMARLFSYICQCYFQGRIEQLSELKIAVEVFGRPETFDRNQDSIARVEAHRLRKKMKHNYETEGKDHELQIELPAGSYVPVFRRAGPALNGEGLGAPVESGGEAIAIKLPPVPETPAPLETGPRRPGFTWWYAAAGLAFLLVIFGLARVGSMHKSTAVGGVLSGLPVAAGLPRAVSEDDAVRFLCGYTGPPHIGRLGEVWGA